MKADSDISQLKRSLALTSKEKAELSTEVERLNCLKNRQDGVALKMEKDVMELKERYEQLLEKSQVDQVSKKSLIHLRFVLDIE